MSLQITPPDNITSVPDYATYTSVFLAGGITDCPDWQAEAVDLLPDDVLALNPRRPHFPIHDPDASRQQIEWEFTHLHEADAILFWFPPSLSPQPIALLELGAYAFHDHHWNPVISIGADPGYSRCSDVAIQTSLFRPHLTVHTTLPRTINNLLHLLGHDDISWK